MIKQKLVAMMSSRQFQAIWCGVFVVAGAAGGRWFDSPAASVLGWVLAGFMANNLLHVVLWERASRKFTASCRAEAEQTQQAITTMVEHMKEELQQYAAERGFDIDVEIGQGEPPPRWRQ